MEKKISNYLTPANLASIVKHISYHDHMTLWMVPGFPKLLSNSHFKEFLSVEKYGIQSPGGIDFHRIEDAFSYIPKDFSNFLEIYLTNIKCKNKLMTLYNSEEKQTYFPHRIIHQIILHIMLDCDDSSKIISVFKPNVFQKYEIIKMFNRHLKSILEIGRYLISTIEVTRREYVEPILKQQYKMYAKLFVSYPIFFEAYLEKYEQFRSDFKKERFDGIDKRLVELMKEQLENYHNNFFGHLISIIEVDDLYKNISFSNMILRYLNDEYLKKYYRQIAGKIIRKQNYDAMIQLLKIASSTNKYDFLINVLNDYLLINHGDFLNWSKFCLRYCASVYTKSKKYPTMLFESEQFDIYQILSEEGFF
jgi:hypothetical protein